MHEHEHDLGLSHDLPTLLNRRRALGLMSAAGLAAALAACGASDETPDPTRSTPSSPEPTATTGSGGQQIPEETQGPFPANGSNGVNVLTDSGIVRKDIRSSFGTASGVADGVPLTLKLTVVDVSGDSAGGQAFAGAAIYVWHCDREGSYSMYSDAAKDENYLRGVQETAADGSVEFTSIFPAAYQGRWPHVHFEVYRSLADAQQATNKQRTSQLAFPEDVCDTVYAEDGYESSVANMEQTPLDSDMVFSDGYSLQMAKVSGSVADGYTATLRVPI